jgi:PAS domain-containing protein
VAPPERYTHYGAVYWWSPETYRIYEFDPTDPPELERIARQTHPEDKDYFEKALERARAEKKDFEIEYRLLMRDGSVKHLQVSPDETRRARHGSRG